VVALVVHRRVGYSARIFMALALVMVAVVFTVGDRQAGSQY
jgi:hypothetical protein